MTKLYDTENRMEEVMGTNLYGAHVHAMTTEGLHSKSDIAVELAWRDRRIADLEKRMFKAEKVSPTEESARVGWDEPDKFQWPGEVIDRRTLPDGRVVVQFLLRNKRDGSFALKTWDERRLYTVKAPPSAHDAPTLPKMRNTSAIREQHADWSDAAFGNVGPIGPLKHLSKEALETAAAPDDLSEWADMQFLFWDAQRRAGITDAQIEQAMVDKLAINKARVWPEPKDGEPREHIKAGVADAE